MAKTEEEERDAKRNANNVTMDTFFHNSPVTINTQRKNANVANERQIYSNILEETIKLFKGLTLQSTIKHSAYYNSEEDVAESDPKSDPLIDNHTIDKNERKSLILKLPKEILNANYLQKDKSQRSSKVSSLRLTKRPRMGLQQVEGLCMRYVWFSIRRSSRARRAALRVFSKILR